MFEQFVMAGKSVAHSRQCRLYVRLQDLLAGTPITACERLMKCRSQRFKFDLPDEWWVAAGMVGFATHRTAYRCNAVRRTMILRIDEIAVPPRGAGVPDFERARMIGVLDAIRRDETLPPIEVVEAISEACDFRLYHGRHRLAASIAVRFSLVRAVVVRDLDEIKRAEGVA